MDEVMLRNNRYKAERVKETVHGACEKFTESVNDARSKTARAKERSRDMATDLQEYASGGLDVSASTNPSITRRPCTASRTERALRT